ncbi:MAG: GtrA family protein [Patescibacteria group bacterium]|nr:GtrA family protein [Patescibacteria group bacterium]
MYFIIAKINKYWLIFPKGFRQFIKYSIVGTSNAIIDFGTYWSLTRSFIFFEIHYLLANAIAFLLAVTWGFIWNKNWSFENKDSRKIQQYTKYITVNLGGLVIIEVILYVLVTLGVYDIAGKAVGCFFAWAWNFTMNRYWTFKEKF